MDRDWQLRRSHTSPGTESYSAISSGVHKALRLSDTELSPRGAHDSVYEVSGALGSPVRSAIPTASCVLRTCCVCRRRASEDVDVALDAVGGMDDPLTVGRVGG
jgi:hypothetical protein